MFADEACAVQVPGQLMAREPSATEAEFQNALYEVIGGAEVYQFSSVSHHQSSIKIQHDPGAVF